MSGEHDDRRLEAILAEHANRFAAVDIGKADVHDDEVDLARAGGLHAFGAGVDRHGFELVMKRELLDQRITHVGVIVDNEDSAGIHHRFGAPEVGRDRVCGPK